MESKETIALSLKRLHYALLTNGLLSKQKDASHVCSHHVCQPIDEVTLIKRQLLTGPPVTTFVYMCRFGYYHVCTERMCHGVQRFGSCPISGKSFVHHQAISSYDKNDSRTYSNIQVVHGVNTYPFRSQDQPRVFKRQKLTNSNINIFEAEADVREEEPVCQEVDDVVVNTAQPVQKQKRRMLYHRVQHIVFNLLYGSIRKRLNREHQDKQAEIKEMQWSRYKQQCGKDGILNVIQGMIIESNCTQPDPFQILEYNHTHEQYYVDTILTIYDRVIQYSSFTNPKTGYHKFIDVESVTLYVLYGMRLGLTIDTIEVLPQDVFLLEHLPAVNTLEHFCLNRRKISIGSKLVRDAYQNALKDKRVSRESLVFNHELHTEDENNPNITLFKSVSRRSKPS